MEYIALLAAVFIWVTQRNRIKRLENEVDALRRQRDFSESVVGELTKRVFALERGGEQAVGEPGPPVAEDRACTAPTLDTPEALDVGAEHARPAEQPLPGPTLAETISERFKGRQWESVVGGSWLNAVGVLVLVIGISLFLGYAITQFGPA